jgi:hypothetical protein
LVIQEKLAVADNCPKGIKIPMKPQELYQELKGVAERLGITVSEQNFRNAGIRVTSGLCKVHGRSMFLMDKHATVYRKIDMLAECLRQLPHDDIFVVPAVRELLGGREKKRLRD